MFVKVKEFLEELNKAFPIKEKLEGAVQLPRHSITLDDNGNLNISIVKDSNFQSLTWTEDEDDLTKGPKEQVADIIEAIEGLENERNT